MTDATLTLSQPAYLTLQSPDGSAVAKLDVYEARRMLTEAERQPSEAHRYAAINKWLAEKLTIDQTALAESTALEFNDAIVALVVKLNAERQKKTSQTQSSLTVTPESPATTAPGP